MKVHASRRAQCAALDGRSKLEAVGTTKSRLHTDVIPREIPEGTRSLAWRLTFRSSERTIKDKEVQGRSAKIVRSLEQLLAKRGPGAFEVSELPPINYETLAELRRRLAREPLVRDAHAG